MIELVDKIDQKSRYGQLGNDLVLQEEGASGADANPGGYVGMEVSHIPQQITKERTLNWKYALVATITMSLVIAISITVSRSNNRPPRSTSHHNNGAPHFPHGGDHHHPPLSPHSHHPPHPSPSYHHSPRPTNPPIETDTTDDTIENDDESSTTVNELVPLWPTKAPGFSFKVCPPKVPHHPSAAVHQLQQVHLVPEDTDNSWGYTLSDMDMNDDASVIAVGLSDFARGTPNAVGMVRVFAYKCYSRVYHTLGQDLLGSTNGEGFGYQVSLSRDGKLMAVSAIQDGLDDDKGYVQVYELSHNKWKPYGQRIENIDVDLDTDDDTSASTSTNTTLYFNLGEAIDLSPDGSHLAVLGIVDNRHFVTRVFEFLDEKWHKKGHDLSMTIQYADGMDFAPDITLSDGGTSLAVADPQIGLLTLEYSETDDRWVQAPQPKMAEWDEDEIWMESMDLDQVAEVVAFSAFVVNGTNNVQIVDFGEDSPKVVYNYTLRDVREFSGIDVSVAKDGGAVAFVASKFSLDDNEFWDYDTVGAMTVVATTNGDGGDWVVVGESAKGVPGSIVDVSGDGTIVAVGSPEAITFYSLTLNRTAITPSDNSAGEVAPEAQNPDTAQDEEGAEKCLPFDQVTMTESDHQIDMNNLPEAPNDEQSIALSLSKDGTFLAVGIDSFDGEDRGMVRVFQWNCTSQNYTQLGDDVYGLEDFDAFGVSVDLVETPKGVVTMVVGANQPPPGKTGYVTVLEYNTVKLEWVRRGSHLRHFATTVEDLGRVVKISNDGATVAVLGQTIEQDVSGSFVRVVEWNNDKWVRKGQDLRKGIDKTDYDALVKIDLSGDGNRLALTGQDSPFVAQVYTYQNDTQIWENVTLDLAPRLDNNTGDYIDRFDGLDVALDYNGTTLVLGGDWKGYLASTWVFQQLSASSGNWTLSQYGSVGHNIPFFGSSVALSSDGTTLVIGDSGFGGTDEYPEVNVTDTFDEESGGAFGFTREADGNVFEFDSYVLGRDGGDRLGNRVAVSGDGRVIATSSIAGYLSFYARQN